MFRFIYLSFFQLQSTKPVSSATECLLSALPQAYIQTSAAVSDVGETVAIIYEEDDAAYLYTPLNNAEEKL